MAPAAATRRTVSPSTFVTPAEKRVSTVSTSAVQRLITSPKGVRS